MTFSVVAAHLTLSPRTVGETLMLKVGFDGDVMAGESAACGVYPTRVDGCDGRCVCFLSEV